jgi:bifunctional non-homologous end joining protein LigD
VSQSADKEPALAGLERWKERHPRAAACLTPEDVMVDAMRGRFKTWTRVRVNLRHVPEADRPPQEPPDPDYDPAVEWASLVAAGRDEKG